ALAGLDRIGLTASRNFAFSANYRDASGFAVFRNINAKRARLADGKRQIRRVYFVDFALAQFADAEIYRAFLNAHLNRIVVKIEKRESGHGGHMNSGLTSLKFGLCILVGPKLVADGHGSVALSAAPVALSTGLKRDWAICITDASHARRRIAFVGFGSLCTEAKKTEQRKQQPKAAYPAGFGLHTISPVLRPAISSLFIRCEFLFRG